MGSVSFDQVGAGSPDAQGQTQAPAVVVPAQAGTADGAQAALTVEAVAKLLEQEREQTRRSIQSAFDRLTAQLAVKPSPSAPLPAGEGGGGAPSQVGQAGAITQPAAGGVSAAQPGGTGAASVGGQAGNVGQAAQAEQPMSAAQVNERVTALYQLAGVTLEDNDPEAVTLDRTGPAAFLRSLEAAVIAKKARLNAPGAVAARSPGLASGGVKAGAITEIMDPAALIQMGLKQRGR